MQRALSGLVVLMLIAAAGYLGLSALQETNTLTLYSGRGESMVKPMIERFEKRPGSTSTFATAIPPNWRYCFRKKANRPRPTCSGARMPAQWARSPRQTSFNRCRNRCTPICPLSIRATPANGLPLPAGPAPSCTHQRVSEDERPDSVFDLTGETYEGRVGWAPTNGSFQSFVTAMRHRHGDERTLQWLEAMDANGAKRFRKQQLAGRRRCQWRN